MLAQTMFEKGLLEGAFSGVSNAVDSVASVFQERPWLAIIVAVLVGLYIFTRRS